MIGPLRRRIAFWTGVVLLSWSALLWLIVAAIALEEPKDHTDLIIGASVMTGAGIWSLLVGRRRLLAEKGASRRDKPNTRQSSNRLTIPESILIEKEKRRVKEELVAYHRAMELRIGVVPHRHPFRCGWQLP